MTVIPTSYRPPCKLAALPSQAPRVLRFGPVGGGGQPPQPVLDTGLDMSDPTATITIPNSGKGLEDLFENEVTLIFDAIVFDNAGQAGHFFSKGDGSTTASGIRGFHRPQTGATAQLMTSIRRSAGNFMQQSTDLSPVITGERHQYGFVIGSLDPTDPGSAALYTDGVRLATSNLQTGSGNWETGAGHPLVIGQTSNGNLPINMRLLKFAIYTGRLSEAEMADLSLAAGKLFAEYKLDEGTGTVASATGPSGPEPSLNGVIANAPWVDENGNPI